jgi:ABC-type transporter Mla subunit MlaD
MADPLRYPEAKGPARRRWVRVFVILALIVILVVVVLLLTLGGHRPGGH